MPAITTSPVDAGTSKANSQGMTWSIVIVVLVILLVVGILGFVVFRFVQSTRQYRGESAITDISEQIGRTPSTRSGRRMSLLPGRNSMWLSSPSHAITSATGSAKSVDPSSTSSSGGGFDSGFGAAGPTMAGANGTGPSPTYLHSRSQADDQEDGFKRSGSLLSSTIHDPGSPRFPKGPYHAQEYRARQQQQQQQQERSDSCSHGQFESISLTSSQCFPSKVPQLPEPSVLPKLNSFSSAAYFGGAQQQQQMSKISNSVEKPKPQGYGASYVDSNSSSSSSHSSSSPTTFTPFAPAVLTPPVFKNSTPKWGASYALFPPTGAAKTAVSTSTHAPLNMHPVYLPPPNSSSSPTSSAESLISPKPTANAAVSEHIATASTPLSPPPMQEPIHAAVTRVQETQRRLLQQADDGEMLSAQAMAPRFQAPVSHPSKSVTAEHDHDESEATTDDSDNEEDVDTEQQVYRQAAVVPNGRLTRATAVSIMSPRAGSPHSSTGGANAVAKPQQQKEMRENVSGGKHANNSSSSSSSSSSKGETAAVPTIVITRTPSAATKPSATVVAATAALAEALARETSPTQQTCSPNAPLSSKSATCESNDSDADALPSLPSLTYMPPTPSSPKKPSDDTGSRSTPPVAPGSRGESVNAVVRAFEEQGGSGRAGSVVGLVRKRIEEEEKKAREKREMERRETERKDEEEMPKKKQDLAVNGCDGDGTYNSEHVDDNDKQEEEIYNEGEKKKQTRKLLALSIVGGHNTFKEDGA